MLNLILLALGVLLLPSVGIGLAISVGIAVDRWRDRTWARDFTAWEAEL